MKAKIVEFFGAHEGELAAMKAKIVEFWLKPVGDALRKRLENHAWWNLCP